MHDSKPIKCLLVDDEPPAREILRRYIDDIATMELAAECSNALQAFTVLQKETMDLAEKKKQAFVYFRIDRKMKKVILEDIMYIESMKDYIKLFTPGGTLITKQSISSVEEMLPVKEFARVHRSYIVSLNNIKSFTAEVIEIGNTN